MNAQMNMFLPTHLNTKSANKFDTHKVAYKTENKTNKKRYGLRDITEELEQDFWIQWIYQLYRMISFHGFAYCIYAQKICA